MTTVHHVSRQELLDRRAALLARLGATEEAFRAKVEAGALVGDEWSAWSELQDIEYLLGATE